MHPASAPAAANTNRRTADFIALREAQGLLTATRLLECSHIGRIYQPRTSLATVCAAGRRGRGAAAARGLDEPPLIGLEAHRSQHARAVRARIQADAIVADLDVLTDGVPVDDDKAVV